MLTVMLNEMMLTGHQCTLLQCEHHCFPYMLIERTDYPIVLLLEFNLLAVFTVR